MSQLTVAPESKQPMSISSRPTTATPALTQTTSTPSSVVGHVKTDVDNMNDAEPLHPTALPQASCRPTPASATASRSTTSSIFNDADDFNMGQSGPSSPHSRSLRASSFESPFGNIYTPTLSGSPKVTQKPSTATSHSPSSLSAASRDFMAVPSVMQSRSSAIQSLSERLAQIELQQSVSRDSPNDPQSINERLRSSVVSGVQSSGSGLAIPPSMFSVTDRRVLSGADSFNAVAVRRCAFPLGMVSHDPFPHLPPLMTRAIKLIGVGDSIIMLRDEDTLMPKVLQCTCGLWECQYRLICKCDRKDCNWPRIIHEGRLPRFHSTPALDELEHPAQIGRLLH